MHIGHLVFLLLFVCSSVSAGAGAYTGEAPFDSITDLRWRLEANWSPGTNSDFSPLIWETRWSQSPPGTMNGSIAVGGTWELSRLQGVSPDAPISISLELKASFLDDAGRPVNPARLAGRENIEGWYQSWNLDMTDNVYPRTEHVPVMRLSNSSLTRDVHFYDVNGVPFDFQQGSTGWGYNYTSTGGYCDKHGVCDRLSSTYSMKIDLEFVPGSYLYASSDPECKEAACMLTGYDVLGRPYVNWTFQMVTQVVPEPSPWMLLIFGITAVALSRRRDLLALLPCP